LVQKSLGSSPSGSTQNEFTFVKTTVNKKLERE